MVRYADLPSVTVDIEVQADPAALWPLITDIELPARFSDEFQGARWVPPATGPALGAVFEGANRHPLIGEWTVPCVVTVFAPERAFGWDPSGPDGRFATWRFTLEPQIRTPPAEPRTTLTFVAQMGFGPSGMTPAIEARPDKEEQIVAHRLEEWRANMQATVEGIKSLAEGGTAGG